MSTSRDPRLLSKDFLVRFEALQERMAEIGDPVFLTEGMRSAERQADLLKQGKSWVRVSYHQSGNAADVAFKTPPIYPPASHPRWAMYGKTAKEFDLAWGGDWKVKDCVHVELVDASVGKKAREMVYKQLSGFISPEIIKKLQNTADENELIATHSLVWHQLNNLRPKKKIVAYLMQRLHEFNNELRK